jgi:hypothetical protein
MTLIFVCNKEKFVCDVYLLSEIIDILVCYAASIGCYRPFGKLPVSFLVVKH